MAEELTDAGGVATEDATTQEGVAPEGATAEGEPTIAEGQPEQGKQEKPQPQAPAPAEEPKRPVDLTQSEEFRKWQAARDRREAELRQQLQQMEQQSAEMRRQMTQMQLRDADPEEIQAFYESELARIEQQQKTAKQEQARRQEVEDAAARLLESHGLDVNTPGLDWSGGATWEGYGRLVESVARLERERAEQVAKQKETVADKVAREAKAKALEQAGVTKVNTAQGQATPKDLRAEFEQEKQRLQHSGDTAGYAALKRKYRGLGLDV